MGHVRLHRIYQLLSICCCVYIIATYALDADGFSIVFGLFKYTVVYAVIELIYRCNNCQKCLLAIIYDACAINYLHISNALSLSYRALFQWMLAMNNALNRCIKGTSPDLNVGDPSSHVLN